MIGATGFIILRSEKKTGSYQAVSGTIKTTSFTDKNLKQNKTYYYKLCTLKGKTRGKASAAVSATTQEPSYYNQLTPEEAKKVDKNTDQYFSGGNPWKGIIITDNKTPGSVVENTSLKTLLRKEYTGDRLPSIKYEYNTDTNTLKIHLYVKYDGPMRTKTMTIGKARKTYPEFFEDGVKGRFSLQKGAEKDDRIKGTSYDFSNEGRPVMFRKTKEISAQSRTTSRYILAEPSNQETK